jgi:septal ring factor EnvC (AmiA/AmiB activator)
MSVEDVENALRSADRYAADLKCTGTEGEVITLGTAVLRLREEVRRLREAIHVMSTNEGKLHARIAELETEALRLRASHNTAAEVMSVLNAADRYCMLDSLEIAKGAGRWQPLLDAVREWCLRAMEAQSISASDAGTQDE